MFCPTCRSDSQERTLLDPYLRGYACKNGDVFFTTLVEHVGGIPTADTIQPPAMDDDLQILKFWLTDRRARKRVPNQLALLCRRLVDIAESDHHVPSGRELFAFCPSCGDALIPFESDDVHMHPSRCSHGHEFWRHGSTVFFVDPRGLKTNLSAELEDAHLSQLIDYYAGDHEIIQPYVHPQLRAVLKRFARQGTSP